MKEWKTLMNPEWGSPQSWIDTLRLALEHARESYTVDQWHEIGEVMAWTTEELGCKDPGYLGLYRGKESDEVR